jgi:hypothetical protein
MALRIVTMNFAKKSRPNPAQIKNFEALAEMKLDKTSSTRYDATTDAQREDYYFNPTLSTRLRKRLKWS